MFDFDFDFEFFVCDLKNYCEKNKIIFDDLSYVCQKNVIKKMCKELAKNYHFK